MDQSSEKTLREIAKFARDLVRLLGDGSDGYIEGCCQACAATVRYEPHEPDCAFVALSNALKRWAAAEESAT